MSNSKQEVKEQVYKCSICKEDIMKDEYTLKCKCRYHQVCLDEYILKGEKLAIHCPNNDCEKFPGARIDAHIIE